MKGLGILLAAGFSKRLGQNKSFVTFRGEYLLDIAINKLKNTEINSRIIIANDKNYDYIKTHHKDLKVILNDKNTGQNSSIKLALSYAKGYDYAMFMAIDQPFLKINNINKIITHFKKGHIIIPKYGNFNGLPTIFSSEFFDDLSNLDGDFGGKKIAKTNASKIIYVKIDDVLQNYDIDTMQDLQVLRRDYGF